jgi:hypothetical protein
MLMHVFTYKHTYVHRALGVHDVHCIFVAVETIQDAYILIDSIDPKIHAACTISVFIQSDVYLKFFLKTS